MSNSILSVKSLKKRFGGLEAVNVDSFELYEGEITSLIGPNGAGKTTFFDLITRFQSADSGSIFLNEKNVTKLNSYKLARLGMVRTFQLTRVFDRMSVYENMKFAGSSVKNEGFLKSLIQTKTLKQQEDHLNVKIDETLKLLNLIEMKDSYARELSGGQKKLLELGRSLMKNPKILLLDEPLAGVNPKLSEELLEIILNLNSQGINILMVEHNIDAVMKISKRVVVMAEGKIISDGKPDFVRSDKKVIEAYLGSSDD
jgi:branched-chain amino acid transport system ATP-binding protein